MKTFLLRYIGPKPFYQRTISVALPLAMTLLLSSCMSIVDSIMVSSIGMVTAVGNASQFLTLHDGISWGITSGIAIYAAQFYGARQYDNMTRTLGLSIGLCLFNCLFWITIAYLFADQILLFYLNDIELLVHSRSYLHVAILSTIPSAFNMSFNVLYRSSQNTKLPFVMSLIGGIGNVFFNAIFIYVLKFGAMGAALGTFVAQSLTMFCYMGEMIRKRPVFLKEFKKIFDLKVTFIRPIWKKSFPLIINETFFGFGSTLFVKAFGMLGTKSMDAYYVANQVFNLFLFSVHGYGGAISVLIGSRLGEGKIEQAKEESNYQLGLGFILGVVMVLIMLVMRSPVLKLFSVSDPSTYEVASGLLAVLSLKVFLRMFNYMMFSTLKAGGDSKIMNFLDSGIMYLVGIPLAFISVYAGIKDIVLVLLICQIEQVVRLIFTMHRYKSGVWAKDLTKGMAR